MAVITISREYGSGGDEIASRLGQLLGYHAFGKQEIARAARETAFPQRYAVDYSEDAHEIRTFLDRLFGHTPTPAQRIAWMEDPSIASRPERSDVDDDAVLSLVRRAILAAAASDNMIIVGRGGQVLLRDTPGALHVRIVAPLEDRIQRVKQQMKAEQQNFQADIDTRRAAQDRITQRDLSSADYIRRFHDADWADPTLYHLTLNLGKLNVEQAAQAIAGLVRAMEQSPQPQ